MMHFEFLSVDIIVLIVIFAILFFVTLRTEKRLITSLILSAYPTLLVFKNFPYVKLEAGLPQAIWFLVLYAVISGIVWRNIHNRRVFTGFRKITDYSLLIVSYIALMISISTHSVPALQNVYKFSGTFSHFVEGLDFGVILIIPLVVILLTSKSDS